MVTENKQKRDERFITKDINYAWPTTAINRDDYTAFEKWHHLVKEKLSDQKLYLFGGGIRGTEFGVFAQRKGITDYLYIDNNTEKQGGHIDGHLIVPPEQAVSEAKSGQAIILIATENDEDIIAQLKESGLSENDTFYTARNLEYENYVKEFLRPGRCDVIIMGDCLFSGISLMDQDTRNLSDMLKEKIGKNHCKVLYMHGMGIRSYYHIFKLYTENFETPTGQCIEIMINFETLTGVQHLLPRSQHSRLFHLLQDHVKRVPEDFKEYVKVTDSRSENLSTEIFHKTKNLTAEQERTIQNRNYLRLNYMYQLNKDTEGLEYFKKFAQYAREREIKVIPFIPPVNYELGEMYFGKVFWEKYESNLKIVKNLTNELGLDLLDFSHTLSADFFAERDTTDESVNEKGRRLLAEALYERIDS